MLLLLASIVALLLGPFLYWAVRGHLVPLGIIDGFIFVSITGLVCLFIIPESALLAGWSALLFAILGFLGPTLIEHGFHRAARQTHFAALLLGIAGLFFHALIDGTALVEPAGIASSSLLLPMAVILHRFPVGLTLWWLLRPAFGWLVAVSVILLVILATLVGFFWGASWTALLPGPALGGFQALVAGSLLHVVFHSSRGPGGEAASIPDGVRARWPEGTGALLGILLLILLGLRGGDPGFWDGPEGIANTFWTLALESAPALLLGYLMAGLLSTFLPPSSVLWLRRGSGWGQSLRGMAVGLPFPVCSCGVVPLYRTLIRQGAPPTAAMAFLIATPELGLDAVLLSFPLLGTEMTLIRVVVAALLALLVGWLVGRMTPAISPPLAQAAGRSGETSPGVLQRLRTGLQLGMGEVVDHTAPWILLGLAVAAVAAPFLRVEWLAAVPDLLEVPLFALLGLPTYVCASGATPLVAVLLLKGVSPGAALAFLLTGPATNVTTFGLLARLHGRRIAAWFCLAMVGLSVLAGYGVNLLFPALHGISLEEAGSQSPSPWQLLSLAALAAIFLSSLLRRGPRRFCAELLFQE